MSAHDTPEVGSGETATDFDSLADWLGNMDESRNVFDITDEATTVITIDVESLAERIVARLERILAAREAAWAEKYAAVVGERDHALHRLSEAQADRDEWQDATESAEAALATALREKAEDRARVEAVEALADGWVSAERAADDHGPSSAYTGYDCAEMLRAALAIPTATGDE